MSVNVLLPGGPTDTRMVPPSAPFARSELIPPAAMAPPALSLASPASDGVTGRRFVAGLWDPALPPEQAAAARHADRLARADHPGTGVAGSLNPD